MQQLLPTRHACCAPAMSAAHHICSFSAHKHGQIPSALAWMHAPQQHIAMHDTLPCMPSNCQQLDSRELTIHPVAAGSTHCLPHLDLLLEIPLHPLWGH